MKRIEEYLVCRSCQSSMGWRPTRSSFSCSSCEVEYATNGGVLDTIGDDGHRPRWSTRILHDPVVVGIYERYWRPALCRLVARGDFRLQVQMVMQALSPEPGQIVLDVGAGTGNFSRQIAKRVGNDGLVVLVDLSKTMLAAASRLARREGLTNIICVRADATRLPFRTGLFDRVNCCGALHLFADIDLGLSEFSRVLTPEGRFGCLTFHREARQPFRALLTQSRDWIGMEFFELADLEARVRRAGFKDYRHMIDKLMTVVSAGRQRR